MVDETVDERIRLSVKDRIATIVLNNPARRNAISLEMWSAISTVLDRLAKDDNVRVAVIRGAGGNFSAGADISQFEQTRGSPDAVKKYDEVLAGSIANVEAFPKPIIAVIEGYCVGAAVATVLACDIRIASPTASFAIPAARLGVGYLWQDIKKLISAVGIPNAKEVLLTGGRFSASEAREMGIVNKVVASAELEVCAHKYCAAIAQNAPLSILGIKATIAELSKASADFDHQRCESLVADCAASEDYQEGIRAFHEKRKPVFVGR